MNKKIVVFFVLTLFIASVTVNALKIDVLAPPGVDQEQTHQDGHGHPIYPQQLLAQIFTPTVDKLTAVQLYLFDLGTPSSGYDITVSITDEFDWVVADFTYLTEVTVNADKIVDYGWLSFDFPDIDIVPGETYAIVVTADHGDIDNNYCWFKSDSDIYDNGKSYYRTKTSNQWTIAGGDFCFKTWYTEEESADDIKSSEEGLFGRTNLRAFGRNFHVCDEDGGLYGHISIGFKGLKPVFNEDIYIPAESIKLILMVNSFYVHCIYKD
ncbi:hypothetical protein ACFL1L_05510 [Thermoplasmatota archaeon]